MKKTAAFFLTNIVLASLISGNIEVSAQEAKNAPKKLKTVISTKKGFVAKYKDGTYTGRYDDGTEGYYCIVNLTIKNNKIIKVNWRIYDIEKRLFDKNYERVFDSKLYKQQCRDNLKGGKTFGPMLIKKQDINKVDTVSGATWSNNLFKGAVTNALSKAKNKKN